jgi:hypothetical protein
VESGGPSGDSGLREALRARAAADRAPAATAGSASAIADVRPASGEGLRPHLQQATAIERRVTDLEGRLNQPADGQSQPKVEIEEGPR